MNYYNRYNMYANNHNNNIASPARGGGGGGHGHHRRRGSDDEGSTSSNSSASSMENRDANIIRSPPSSTRHQKIHWKPNRRSNYRPRVHPDPTTGGGAMKDAAFRYHQPHAGGKSATTPNTTTTTTTAPLCIPPSSQFVALDCEMVGIGPGGYTSVAARVTIIDWNGHILLDEYIQQTQPVTDYRTFVSGITAEHLQGATMTLDDCRIRVLQLLQNRILVGHALKNDLDVLGIHQNHIPWWMIRDTAKYEPFMQLHYHTGVLCPRKLKHLVSEKLGKDIQVVGRPHSPYEDALAALDLYRSVQPQWEALVKYQVDRAAVNTTSNKQHHHHYHQQQRQQQMAAAQAQHAARYNYVMVQ